MIEVGFVSNAGKVALASMLIAGLSLGTPAYSKSKKKDEAEPEPCPVDTVIRTADKSLLKRFGMLEGCADQLLIAPAEPSEYENPDDVRIARENSPGTDQSQYAYDGDRKADEDPGLRYADLDPAAKPKPVTADGKKAEVDARGTQVYYFSEASLKPSYSGTGVAVRIRPEVDEKPVEALPSHSPAARQRAPSAGGTNSILDMRPRSYRTAFDQLIADTARRYRIDPLLLHAVIKQESGYRNNAVSHAGARGLMQIMPATGRGLGVATPDLHNAYKNVDAGARLLRRLWFKYNGNIDLMLAAYNAGEGAVKKYGNRIPPYRETQNYVKAVKAHYRKLLAEQGSEAPRP